MRIDRGQFTRAVSATAVVVACMIAGRATAQQKPCQEDLKRLCPNVTPGSADARKCLKEHLDQLSEGCRSRIASARERRGKYPARFAGCEGDLEKFCKEVQAGGGRLIKCLREHETEITAECKAKLPGAGAGRRGGGGGGGGGQGGGGGGGGPGSGGGHGRDMKGGNGNQPSGQASSAATPQPTTSAK